MHSPRDGVDEGGRLRPPFFVFGCRRRCGSGRWPDVPFRCLLPSFPSAAFPSLMSGLPHQRRRHEGKNVESSGGRHFFPSFRPATSPSFGHISLLGGDRRGRETGEADRNGKRIGQCFHRPLPVASTSLMSTLFPTEATGRNSDGSQWPNARFRRLLGCPPSPSHALSSRAAVRDEDARGSERRRPRHAAPPLRPPLARGHPPHPGCPGASPCFPSIFVPLPSNNRTDFNQLVGISIYPDGRDYRQLEHVLR